MLRARAKKSVLVLPSKNKIAKWDLYIITMLEVAIYICKVVSNFFGSCFGNMN
jgi:hypothetical protein